jgi:hypothetical protein
MDVKATSGTESTILLCLQFFYIIKESYKWVNR